MRTIGIVIVVALAVCLEIAVGQTTNYAGTWSNKKSEFYTVGFGLRHDGRGVFGAAIGSTFLRWTNTVGGIVITIAGDGQSTNMLLHYAPATDRLSSSNGSNSTQVFFRISTNEPPDAEADYEARLEREHAERMLKHPPPPPTTIATVEDFRTRVLQLASQSNSMSRLSITSANKKSFLLSKVNYLASIMLNTVRAGTFPKVAGDYSKKKPEGLYEATTLVPEDRVIEFRRWLDEHGTKNDVGYYVFRSPWRIEGYYQFCEVNIASNNTVFIDAVQHLVEETLAPFEFPLEAR